MKAVIFGILLPVAVFAAGCAHAQPTASSDWSRIQTYLSTLHVGMTPKVAEQELQHWDCVPIGTLSSALSHRQSYIFLSDASVVTLQFDEHDRLISWEAKQRHSTFSFTFEVRRIMQQSSNGLQRRGHFCSDANPYPAGRRGLRRNRNVWGSISFELSHLELESKPPNTALEPTPTAPSAFATLRRDK